MSPTRRKMGPTRPKMASKTAQALFGLGWATRKLYHAVLDACYAKLDWAQATLGTRSVRARLGYARAMLGMHRSG